MGQCFINWETEKETINNLALQAKEGDDKALSILLVTGRVQYKFIKHANVKARRSRFRTADDMLQYLMLVIWQALRSEEKAHKGLRWDEGGGMDFPYWVLRCWNHRMDLKNEEEKRKKRLPIGGFTKRILEDSLNLQYAKVSYQPNSINRIAMEIFLGEVERLYDKKTRELCELLTDGYTKADIAEVLYPDVSYQKRWARVNLLFKSLKSVAEDVGFIK